MTGYRIKLVAAVAAAGVLLTGIYISSKGNGTMEIDQERLKGSWVKVSTEKCARNYPAQIEFLADGIYKAPDGPDIGAIWHGGDWLLTEDRNLKMQASNDAMLSYTITFDGEHLALTDYADCTVLYRQN